MTALPVLLITDGVELSPEVQGEVCARAGVSTFIAWPIPDCDMVMPGSAYVVPADRLSPERIAELRPWFDIRWLDQVASLSFHRGRQIQYARRNFDEWTGASASVADDPKFAKAAVIDPAPMTAPDILAAAAQHMRDRASQRDQEGGERSMQRIVATFNALTGHNLTERDGWAFMVALKLGRAYCTPTGTPDDYQDGAAYFGLMGECAGK